MSTQVQGVSDNLQELLARMGKLNQQLTDAQNAIQGIDAKLASGAPPPAAPAPAPSPGNAPARLRAAPQPLPALPAGVRTPRLRRGSRPRRPAPSADLLYSNGLRDMNGQKYDLAAQEFQDYLKYYRHTDLASNAQFYLGEIAFAQEQYDQAVDAYGKVIDKYPEELQARSRASEERAGSDATGREGLRRARTAHGRGLYPGTDEERRARAKLQELGVRAVIRNSSVSLA